VVVDIEVEGAVILFALSPGMCLWRTVNMLEHKYMFFPLVQDNSSQTNQQKMYVSHIYV